MLKTVIKHVASPGAGSSRVERFLPLLVLTVMVYCYYYFFCENLPWFWYDDINVLERADASTILENFKDIFNLLPKTFTVANRPVLILFSKLCTAMFGEVPQYHRMFKLLFVIAACWIMVSVAVRYHVKQSLTIMLLLFFSTLPPVFIVNAWIYESEALELFFKAASFAVFLVLCDDTRHDGMKKTLYCLLLLLLVIVADKTKAPAKIIPILFLYYLVITRNRDIKLYATVLAALAAVVPYAVFFDKGLPIYHPSGSVPLELLKTFATQMWGPLAIGAISALIAGKSAVRNNLFLFASGWLVCELLFFVVYPSDEMRYLYSAMAAACFWTAIATSHLSLKLNSTSSQYLLFSIVICVVASLGLQNTRWVYNFRGSFCSVFILADKHMRYVNRMASNSLLLYDQSTEYYYKRYTTNDFISPMIFERDKRLSSATLLNRPYENVFAVDSVCNTLASSIKLDCRWLTTFTADNGSLFDKMQSKAQFSIRHTSLYDNRLGQIGIYPMISSLFVMAKKHQP